MNKLNWTKIRQELRADIVALPHFFKNPVRFMRELPQWNWPTILLLQAAFVVACSVLANFIERDFFGLITGLVIAPLTGLLMASVATGFFYYFFQFIFKREVPFRQIYIHVFFASIPLLIVSTIAFYLPPLVLLGMATSLTLLFIGFVANFQIPRRPLRKLLIGILAVHVLYWGFQQVQSGSRHKSLRQKATPESLDILEKELNE